MGKQRALVIAHAFPPMGGGGVQRTLSFVRRLPDLGFDVTVLTTAEPERYWAQDPGLLNEVPDDVAVERVSDTPLHSARARVQRRLPAGWRARFQAVMNVPDREGTWAPYAARAARSLHRARPFDVVYSTSPPATDHLVAAALVRADPELRWVADFRDPWTRNQTFEPASPVHRSLDQLWEARIVERADVVIANTVINRIYMQDDFPSAAHKIVTIPNGWEQRDFVGLPRPSKQGPLLVGYSGAFYPGYQPDAFFRYLVDALSADLEQRGSSPSTAPGVSSLGSGISTVNSGAATWPKPPRGAHLQVRLSGNTRQAQAIAAAGLEDVVIEQGYLPYPDSLADLARCHATLMILPDCPEPSGWVPQKLYQYLRLDRPVIAVCPPGEARDILRQAGGRHLILDPKDPRGGPRLLEWLRALQEVRTEPAGFDDAVVARYDRAGLAHRLTEHLRP